MLTEQTTYHTINILWMTNNVHMCLIDGTFDLFFFEETLWLNGSLYDPLWSANINVCLYSVNQENIQWIMEIYHQSFYKYMSLQQSIYKMYTNYDKFILNKWYIFQPIEFYNVHGTCISLSWKLVKACFCKDITVPMSSWTNNFVL